MARKNDMNHHPFKEFGTHLKTRLAIPIDIE